MLVPNNAQAQALLDAIAILDGSVMQEIRRGDDEMRRMLEEEELTSDLLAALHARTIAVRARRFEALTQVTRLCYGAQQDALENALVQEQNNDMFTDPFEHVPLEARRQIVLLMCTVYLAVASEAWMSVRRLSQEDQAGLVSVMAQQLFPCNREEIELMLDQVTVPVDMGMHDMVATLAHADDPVAVIPIWMTGLKAHNMPALRIVRSVVPNHVTSLDIEGAPLLTAIDVHAGTLGSVRLRECPAVQLSPALFRNAFSVALENMGIRLDVLRVLLQKALPENEAPAEDLPQVQWLSLSDNPLLDNLDSLPIITPALHRLLVRNCPFSSADFISRLPLLESVDLSSSLIEELPEDMPPSLYGLSISNTRIAQLPPAWNLERLTELYLNNCAVAVQQLPWARLQALRALAMEQADLTNEVLANIQPWPQQLITLSISRNREISVLPAALTSLPALRDLYVCGLPLLEHVEVPPRLRTLYICMECNVDNLADFGNRVVESSDEVCDMDAAL